MIDFEIMDELLPFMNNKKKSIPWYMMIKKAKGFHNVPSKDFTVYESEGHDNRLYYIYKIDDNMWITCPDKDFAIDKSQKTCTFQKFLDDNCPEISKDEFPLKIKPAKQEVQEDVIKPPPSKRQKKTTVVASTKKYYDLTAPHEVNDILNPNVVKISLKTHAWFRDYCPHTKIKPIDEDTPNKDVMDRIREVKESPCYCYVISLNPSMGYLFENINNNHHLFFKIILPDNTTKNGYIRPCIAIYAFHPMKATPPYRWSRNNISVNQLGIILQNYDKKQRRMYDSLKVPYKVDDININIIELSHMFPTCIRGERNKFVASMPEYLVEEQTPAEETQSDVISVDVSNVDQQPLNSFGTQQDNRYYNTLLLQDSKHMMYSMTVIKLEEEPDD